MTRVSIRILKNSKTFASNAQNPTLTKNLVPSSSSLQTIQNSNSISLSNPLYNFLPENQNPNNFVNLIYSSLKRDNTHLTLLQNDDVKGLIHHLGANEISRVLLRCQSDSVSALTFFNWVKNDLGLKPSTLNYCHILHVLAWSKEFEQAMKFLTELIPLVKETDEDVFQCLFLCCQDCNWDPIIFDLLLKAYVKADALSLKAEIVVGNINPNLLTYKALIRCLCRMGRSIEAEKLMEEMLHFGLQPDPEICRAMIHGYCREKDAGKAESLLVASVRWVDDHWEFKTDIAVSFGLQSYHSAGCGVLDRRWKKWIVRYYLL
ncbi:hypothetical protein D5086_030491 [Populus alba]|uniref:Uncharacterized protein n=1 Tax=Populus alba TaxID=43335 RepID=A0ACC4ANS7_POPAL